MIPSRWEAKNVSKPYFQGENFVSGTDFKDTTIEINFQPKKG